jgi:hypothetical protein
MAKKRVSADNLNWIIQKYMHATTHLSALVAERHTWSIKR